MNPDQSTNYDKMLLKVESVPSPTELPKSTPRHCWKCEECGDSFSSAINLHKHKRTHGFGVQCSHCSAQFTVNQSLIHHMKKMHSDAFQNQFQCPTCKLSFRSKTQLRDHAGRVHKVWSMWSMKRKKCDQCGETFKNLKAHKKTHGEGFKCSVCSSEFREPRTLHKHQIKAHGVKKSTMVWKPRPKTVPCEDCGTFFVNIKKLVRHQKTHWKGSGTVYPCPICGSKFAFASALTRHKNRVHVQTQDSKSDSTSESSASEDEEDEADNQMDPLSIPIEEDPLSVQKDLDVPTTFGFDHNNALHEQNQYSDEIMQGGNICPVKIEQMIDCDEDNCDISYHLKVDQQDFEKTGSFAVKEEIEPVDQKLDDNLFL